MVSFYLLLVILLTCINTVYSNVYYTPKRCNYRYKNCKSERRKNHVNDGVRMGFRKVSDDVCCEERLACLAKYCRIRGNGAGRKKFVTLVACLSKHAIPPRISDALDIFC
ncbi:hypothetical protein ScPMuIL_013311 [Solemya velum]